MAKILLIEDDPDNIELTCEMLTLQGYEVVHAPDAETGLQVALAELPDLILLDLGLPDHDGQTLAGWMRNETVLDATPIILFTAWPQETAKQMAKSYGCNGYISKPIGVREFTTRVASFLKKN